VGVPFPSGTFPAVSRLDSAPPPEANPQVRRRQRRPHRPGPLWFVVDSVAMGWRWLVRMKTALILLGILAVQTAIATAVPQEPNVRATVEAWRAGEEGPGIAVSRVLDAIGAYDVYGSPLFLALLMLLFLSLTACLIPRIRSWVRLVRHSRPPLVRSVGTNDLVDEVETERDPDEVHEVAAGLLEERHWRVRRHRAEEPTGPRTQVAAEKGLWSREGGSLLFHVSFYVLLAAIVFGQLLSFEGQVGLVEEDRGFTDTEVAYWTYRPGRWFGPEQHAGWRMQLDAFEVDWVRDPSAPGAGQPTTFRSAVTITDRDGRTEDVVIEGNKPHTVDGFKIHQLDWGYAPRVVIEADGEVVHDDFLTMVALDVAGFRGAAKAPAADPDVGLGLFLYPFAPDGEPGQPPTLTGAPWDDDPLLIVSQYRGDLQLGATQQSIIDLDTSRLELEGGAFLRLGDSIQIEGVTVSFPELRRWVGFQVSARPQIPWLLFGSALLVAGLFPALYAYRRRLWVVATRSSDEARTLVRVSGRSFQRPERFEEEHAGIVAALAQATGASPPSASPPPSSPDPADDTPEPARQRPATEVMTR
jgi:cytochrome c biogenesis protein